MQVIEYDLSKEKKNLFDVPTILKKRLVQMVSSEKSVNDESVHTAVRCRLTATVVHVCLLTRKEILIKKEGIEREQLSFVVFSFA